MHNTSPPQEKLIEKNRLFFNGFLILVRPHINSFLHIIPPTELFSHLLLLDSILPQCILTGKAKTKEARQTIINPDWNFEKMGIGGLDKEFSDIFRRAFASRVFPPDIVEQMGERAPLSSVLLMTLYVFKTICHCDSASTYFDCFLRTNSKFVGFMAHLMKLVMCPTGFKLFYTSNTSFLLPMATSPLFSVLSPSFFTLLIFIFPFNSSPCRFHFRALSLPQGVST